LASGFNPRQVAGLAIWLDALDEATYTESSGQITEWRSKAGTIKFEQTTANNRPTLFESSSDVQGATQAVINNRQAFYFDGTNDQLVGSATNGDRQWTAFAACRTDNTAATQGVFSRDPSNVVGPVSNRGPQFLRHSSAGVMQSLAFTDSTGPAATAGTLTSGVAAVINAVQTDSTLQAFLNGVGGTAVSATQNSSVTTPRVGGVLPAAEFWKGTVGEILLYSRALTTAERQKVEGYLAWKWGMQAQLPSNHPYAYSFPGFGSQARPDNGDALAWESAVYSNSGSVSVGTLAAVNSFCNAIDAASIRDRFYRLNLFAGTGLNAALVPVYRGASLGGTQYGNATDTNNGPFVSGDYAETGASGGLLGNGSSKYLDTGLTQATVEVNGHHAFYHDRTGSKVGSRSLGGATNGARTQRYTNFASTGTDALSATFGGTQIATASGILPGLNLTTRRGNTDLEQYAAGVSVATNTLSASASTIAINFGVFATLGLSDTNAVDTAFGYWNDRIKAYSFGLDMTTAQAEDYYDAMQAFQTALGRNA
jgi:hypothetical protein